MDNTWWTKVPFLITHVFDTKYEWCLKSIPQVHANNRVLKQVRGKVLGGSRCGDIERRAKTWSKSEGKLLLSCVFSCL